MTFKKSQITAILSNAMQGPGCYILYEDPTPNQMFSEHHGDKEAKGVSNLKRLETNGDGSYFRISELVEYKELNPEVLLIFWKIGEEVIEFHVSNTSKNKKIIAGGR